MQQQRRMGFLLYCLRCQRQRRLKKRVFRLLKRRAAKRRIHRNGQQQRCRQLEKEVLDARDQHPTLTRQAGGGFPAREGEHLALDSLPLPSPAILHAHQPALKPGGLAGIVDRVPGNGVPFASPATPAVGTGSWLVGSYPPHESPRCKTPSALRCSPSPREIAAGNRTRFGVRFAGYVFVMNASYLSLSRGRDREREGRRGRDGGS